MGVCDITDAQVRHRQAGRSRAGCEGYRDLGQEVALADRGAVAAHGSASGIDTIPRAGTVGARYGLQETYLEVAAHIDVWRGEGDFHLVVANGKGTGIYLRHRVIIGKGRHSCLIRLRQINTELGNSPVDIGVAGVEGQLVNGAVLHSRKGCGRNDELALGDIVNPQAIDRHVAVGGGAVVHGEHVCIGRGECDGIAPNAVVVHVTVGANRDRVSGIRGKASEVVRIGGGADEVGRVTVEANLPFGGGAVLRPA